jgi:hypothetical protein
VVAGEQAGAGQAQHQVGCERLGDVRLAGIGGDVGAGRRLQPPPGPRTLALPPVQGGHPHAERRAQVGDQVGQRPVVGERAGERGHGLGLGPRPGRVEPAAPDAVDEHADHAGGHDVDAEGEDVLGLGDVPLEVGRREVPVGEHEAGQDGAQGREHAADQRDGHGEHQVEQQHGGQPDRVAHAVERHRQQRQARGRHAPAPELAPAGERGEDAAQAGESAAPGLSLVGSRRRDDVDVDRPGQAGHPVDDRPLEQLLPGRAAAGAEDDLGGVLGPGEVDEGGGHVAARDLPEDAAHLLQQPAVLGDAGRRALRQARVRLDVDAQQLAARALGHAGGPADQHVAGRRPGHGDDDALAGLPRLGDAVALAVLLERVVDAVGDPEQGELPQGGQVAGPEVVGERGADLLGPVDVAVGHAAAQGLGRLVDHLDLVGGAHHVVGDRLPLPDPRDALDDVVERLEVLDVERGDHLDAGVEQLGDVLPALGVPAAGDVGVGQLVDERHLGPPGQHGVDVHLLEHRAAVVHPAAGHDLEVADLLGGAGAPVRLHEPDDHVGAALLPAPPLVEHGERLADSRGGAQVDAQDPPAGGPGPAPGAGRLVAVGSVAHCAQNPMTARQPWSAGRLRRAPGSAAAR